VRGGFVQFCHALSSASVMPAWFAQTLQGPHELKAQIAKASRIASLQNATRLAPVTRLPCEGLARMLQASSWAPSVSLTGSSCSGCSCSCSGPRGSHLWVRDWAKASATSSTGSRRTTTTPDSMPTRTSRLPPPSGSTQARLSRSVRLPYGAAP
jgi:hypothetical protein